MTLKEPRVLARIAFYSTTNTAQYGIHASTADYIQTIRELCAALGLANTGNEAIGEIYESFPECRLYKKLDK